MCFFIMTSREIILRILNHRQPPRIGFDFLNGNPSDILRVSTASLVHPIYSKYSDWGRSPEVLAKLCNFSGEVKMTPMGNIFGRFNKKTQGECIKGVLQDGWELLSSYALPEIDMEADKKAQAMNYHESEKFVLGSLPFAVFSSLRDSRHMDNALMDTLTEEDNVRSYLDKIVALAVKIISLAHKNGVDGVIIYDDLGMQHALFISPATFRSLLKPYYKRLADELHNRGMKFFVHSCGKVYDVIPDFIEAGVDAFQFDQPELAGSSVLASEFGSKASFYCPVDIQKIMATGDKSVIEDGALNMVNQFKKHGGSLIAMDYGNWQDLNVTPEWQQWARDIIIANSQI